MTWGAKNYRSLKLFIGLFLSLSSSAALADTVIDTSTGWDNMHWLATVGENGSTDGQTFAVPSATSQLDSFSFWVGVDDFGPLRFAAYVAAWDGKHLTGPILYESPLQTLTGSGGPTITHKVTFNTGGLRLTPGSQYLAFISTSTFHDGIFDQGALGFRDADLYSGGQTFTQSNGSDFNALFQSPWDEISGNPGADLVFQATFVVPEPNTVWLLSGGCLLMAAWRRRCIKLD